MKRLPDTFTRNGFTYTLVKRAGDMAIYEQTAPKVSKSTFEVVRIQHHDGFEMHGSHVPASEFYPSSNAWGTDGFTYTNLDDAFRRFDRLQECHSLH